MEEMRTGLFLVMIVALVAPVAASPVTPAPAGSLRALLERARDHELPPAERRDAAQRALEIARSRGDAQAVADATFAMAQAEWDGEDLGAALEHCDTARRLYRKVGDAEGALSALRRSGDILHRLGDYGGAMDRYVAALDEARRLEERQPSHIHRLAVGHVHVTMGNVLRSTGDERQALAEYREALKIYGDEGYRLGEAGVELNIGNILSDEDRNEEALPYFQRAVELARGTGSEPLLSMALTNLGTTEVHLGRLHAARTAIEESIRICKRIGRTRGLMHNHAALGELLAASGRPRRALVEYERAQALARKLEDRRQQAEIHHEMAEVLHGLGRDTEAFGHLLLEREISRKILDAEQAARISGLRTASQAKRREAQLLLLRQREAAERARNRLLWLGLGIVFLLFVVAVGGLLSRARAHRRVQAQQKELQQAYRRVDELSRTDELTGLRNRRDALEYLSREVQRSSRTGETFALGIADVDGLKAVNDRFGHHVGDRLLTAVARAMLAGLRFPDYVARWGGDEFLLVLHAVDREGLRNAMDRLMEAVRSADVRHDDGVVRPTLSCGLVLCNGGDPNRWLKAADAALYRAKSQGRDRYEIAEG